MEYRSIKNQLAYKKNLKTGYVYLGKKSILFTQQNTNEKQIEFKSPKLHWTT